jgi:hypothetical protein
MRLTYGNTLGGVPRSNIPAPAEEIRYSPIKNEDGTKTPLTDWRLYFKDSSDGGILPEYNIFDEKGEFSRNNISYAFRDVRLVPVYDETNNRLTEIVAGNILPGRWDLVADLYLYLRRDVIVESQGESVLKEVVSGIIQSDILLANGELEYKIEDCGNNRNIVDWYYKFSIEDIESLGNITVKQKSNTTGKDVEVRSRITGDRKNTVKKLVPLAKRGATPKGKGIVPESGEFVDSRRSTIITWDGFTIDQNETIPTNLDAEGGYVKHHNPIVQNIVWQTIWKTWMGWRYDEVSVDPTNPRLDDGDDYYDGALLALEADGHPLKSDFAPGYYIPRGAKWLRVSTRLDDDGYENICRGKTNCVSKLSSDDCTKLPFTLLDIKKRPDLNVYTFISKDMTKFYPIPGKPCYHGLPATYDVTSFYEYTSSKECFDGRIDVNGNLYGNRVIKYEYEITSSIERVIEWENIIRNTIDKTCECYELSIQNPPYIDPNDPNNCNVLHTDTIYTICPDDGRYYYNNRIVPPNAYPTRLEIRHIDRKKCPPVEVGVYHSINLQKDFLNAFPLQKTKGTFNATGSLSECFTSSIQSSNSKLYYTDISVSESIFSKEYEEWDTVQSTWTRYMFRFGDTNYDESVIKSEQEIVCFSLLYGNKFGYGSKTIGEREKDSPSKSNYTQYRLLTLDNFEEEYVFYNTGSLELPSDDFYALKFNTDLMYDRIDPGNLQFSLKAEDGLIYHFIDDSTDLTNNRFYSDSPDTYFNIVSGSLLNGIHSSGVGTSKTNTQYTTYGVFYPSMGIIIFDSNKLKNVIGIETDLSTNIHVRNELLLFNSINDAIKEGHSFLSRSSVQQINTNYFVRVPSHAANYSNNPTYSDKNNSGVLYHPQFQYEPVTFVTNVGLYNESNELLAVAKLSKPLKKTMGEELLINVKLDI